MSLRFVSLILLSNILLLTCDHGYGVTEMIENQQLKITKENNLILMKNSEDKGTIHATKYILPITLSRANHDMAAKQLYFTIDDLHIGKTASFESLTLDLSYLPPFLPREKADSIPFSLEEFQNILQLFSISQDSSQAKAIETTLTDCESKPIEGEEKFCATSFESMLDSVGSIFGSKTPFRALSTPHFNLQQKYTLQQVKEVKTSKTVACHAMHYPYEVFYCHSLEGTTKVVEILLGGAEDGEKVTAFFVCHMDTSAWEPDHISFRVLGIKPGTSPVCHFVHFFPQAFLWVG